MIVRIFRGGRELKTSDLLVVFNFPIKLTFLPYIEVFLTEIYTSSSKGDYTYNPLNVLKINKGLIQNIRGKSCLLHFRSKLSTKN